MTDKRECLACSKALRGRSDQKFCSDYCRNTYNNKVNASSRNLVRNTNNRLRKNYKILREVCPDKMKKVSRSKLYGLGYDFNYMTSIYTTKAGKIYYYCYDMGYTVLEEELLLVVKRD